MSAVNLYGYGRTPPWSSDAAQSLDDQARLVETALPRNADTVCVVGHSFGGSVAMKLAARLSGRVTKLVLLETNPFYLLEQAGRADAFAEAMDLRNCVKRFGELCCTDQQPRAVSPRSDILREANVVRPAELEHPVQRGDSNGHLGRLPASGP
jgi:pimeloyl-ACP methyl ester carboxylesterase